MKRLLFMLLGAMALALPAYSVRGVDAAPAKKGVSPPAEGSASVEERRLRAAVAAESDRLREREEALRLRELELKTLEAQVDKKLAEMKKLREELDTALARKTEAENEKIRDLGQMYEKMDSARAALLLAAIDEKLAVEILGVMKKKAAGKVLGNMEQKKAARLSEAYPELGGR